MTTTNHYCGQCGKPTEEATHDRCAARAELEPPRYCAQCARRMVVQIVPTGWTARCSEHGLLHSPAVNAP
jgi:NADH pyrophosphatase NudC (nudix superfamily)